MIVQFQSHVVWQCSHSAGKSSTICNKLIVCTTILFQPAIINVDVLISSCRITFRYHQISHGTKEIFAEMFPKFINVKIFARKWVKQSTTTHENENKTSPLTIKRLLYEICEWCKVLWPSKCPFSQKKSGPERHYFDLRSPSKAQSVVPKASNYRQWASFDRNSNKDSWWWFVKVFHAESVLS